LWPKGCFRHCANYERGAEDNAAPSLGKALNGRSDRGRSAEMSDRSQSAVGAADSRCASSRYLNRFSSVGTDPVAAQILRVPTVMLILFVSASSSL
jgi:hypothetical protein